MMSRLGDQVSVLGFGEPLHGGEEFLTLRNRFSSDLSKRTVLAPLLVHARAAYLGEVAGDWRKLTAPLRPHVDHVVLRIRALTRP